MKGMLSKLALVLGIMLAGFLYETSANAIPSLVSQSAVAAVSEDRNAISKNSRICMEVGNLSVGNQVLYATNQNREGVAGWELTDRVAYFGTANTFITFIRITDNAPHLNALCSILSGGLGSNHVTVGLRTALGTGYDFNIEYYGFL